MRPTLKLCLVTAGLLMLHAPAFATDDVKPVGVVELFTSQGCNSCPPADKLLAELAERKDVVALAYHVDYWDYLGWRDTFGRADNTQRQQEYNRAFQSRAVYTPQAVLNGVAHFNGAKDNRIRAALDAMADGGGLTVPVSMSYTADSVVIEIGAYEGRPVEAQVTMVYFDEPRTVEIKKGRNAGTDITYARIVTGFHSAGMWHGKSARFEMPLHEVKKKGKGGCAVLVQKMDANGLPGEILGAAQIVSGQGY